MKKTLLLFTISLFLFASEPSAFEAGNLESPNPYGLTSSEKFILKNKKDIERLKKDVATLSLKVENLQESIEGIKSVVEGIDSNLNKIRLNIEDIKKDRDFEKKEIENKVSSLYSDLNKTIKLQEDNFNQIKSVLKELTSLIDNINSSYVSKNEFEKEIKDIYSYIDKKISLLKKEQKIKTLSKKSGAELFKEGKKLYNAKKYEEAKRYFLESIKKHYKPATSSFYIGEICYYQKDYECAIKYYKKSASLYSKSSFMPTLMLHTAISLEKIGEKEKAKIFYKNLIKKYPKSKAAKIAKKKI